MSASFTRPARISHSSGLILPANYGCTTCGDRIPIVLYVYEDHTDALCRNGHVYVIETRQH